MSTESRVKYNFIEETYSKESKIPLIAKLFNKYYLDTSLNGNYDEIKEQLVCEYMVKVGLILK